MAKQHASLLFNKASIKSIYSIKPIIQQSLIAHAISLRGVLRHIMRIRAVQPLTTTDITALRASHTQ
ncbi:hypothetical protein EXD76_01480 [BEV proteobacterium]|nr:hypothetical protein [Candidatus Symbiopectobacterium sp. Chty_BC]